ncbi:hypothetical protein QBC33DRAFT_565639 [Phialemonium atrogriseum]|uniref:DUF7587 domain-containing protein n=1 Tax=Phialemonium atrogriseum TaxID=1093897 RepID=A0AAJ0C7P9_9PEZI|nr:uncharacterized protein QBC33DRAFT_565639 [Phialemonium atrogriseum]KAK1771475.1 hypothetical protein QBC33DRAFT_565639 [Phialemonium atrogriseum]
MAADMLWNHMNWKDLKDDNLVSWTTSLIFAVQHGLRRVKMDRGKPDLSDVRICIVDTRDFPRGTFIKDLDILEAYSDLPDIRSFLRLRQSQYYFGEYSPRGVCRSLAGHSMPLCDFYSAWDSTISSPGSSSSTTPWLNASTIFGTSLQRQDVRKAISIAQGCFGSRFALVVAAMLLSLRPRKSKDRVILDAFGATFTDDEIRDLSLHDFRVDGKRLPEVQQFADIIRDISQELAPAPLEGPGEQPARVDRCSYPDLSSVLPSPSLTGVDKVVVSLSNLTVSP